MNRTVFGSLAVVAVLILMVSIGVWSRAADADTTVKGDAIPLKEAKLNIEHNATDNDTGFQGFIDSEGWERMDMTGPDGKVLSFKAMGDLRDLGLTELFFESVEPANADVSIDDVLATLPEGNYVISGKGMEAGEKTGSTNGTALLTHNIPAGPELLTPAEGSVVPLTGVTMSWEPVTQTITGGDVTIVAYQLIVETAADPHPNMIGKLGLSMYVGPSITTITLPSGFLEPETQYSWEVLAIEESGNQTLASSEFETE